MMTSLHKKTFKTLKMHSLSPFMLIGLSLVFPVVLNAQEAIPPEREDQVLQVALMVGVTMVFFYFLMWKPEQKRRVELEKQRAQIKKGDKVTAMGIIGQVFRVNNETVILKMIDGSKIEMLKAAITDIHPSEQANLLETENSNAHKEKQ